MLCARIETALTLNSLPVNTASGVPGRFGRSAQSIFCMISFQRRMNHVALNHVDVEKKIAHLQ